MVMLQCVVFQLDLSITRSDRRILVHGLDEGMSSTTFGTQGFTASELKLGHKRM